MSNAGEESNPRKVLYSVEGLNYFAIFFQPYFRVYGGPVRWSSPAVKPGKLPFCCTKYLSTLSDWALRRAGKRSVDLDPGEMTTQAKVIHEPCLIGGAPV